MRDFENINYAIFFINILEINSCCILWLLFWNLMSSMWTDKTSLNFCVALNVLIFYGIHMKEEDKEFSCRHTTFKMPTRYPYGIPVKQGEIWFWMPTQKAEVGNSSLREIGIFMAFKSWDGMKSQESSLGNYIKERKDRQNEANLEMN